MNFTQTQEMNFNPHQKRHENSMMRLKQIHKHEFNKGNQFK